MTWDPANLLQNGLLATLPAGDLERLAAFLKYVTLQQGAVLYYPGDEVEEVYFPCAGMVSHAVMMRDGKAVETAAVGREGAIGAMAGLGPYSPYTRAVAQLPLTAFRISAPNFRAVALTSAAVRDMIVRGADNLLIQAQVTAACNALHSLEQRLARWILHSRDRSDGDAIPLTQELLSQALGVTRSSVSEAASRLQSNGVIRYTRGHIEITDERALESAACECYGAIARRTSSAPPGE